MTNWPVSTLTNPEARTLPYVLTAWASGTLPALLIVAVLTSVLPAEMLEAVDSAVIDDSVPLGVQAFGIVIFAPIVETLIMAALFALGSIFRIPPKVQIALQTAIWGVAHGAIAFAWAFAPAWLFFVLSVVYVTQRRRSHVRAFALTALVHALNNGLAMASVIAERA